MNIFGFDNYKEFVRAKVKSMPRKGHGQYLKIAKLLGIHTTMVTHIFKGDSHLSIEQALKLAEHWGSSENETEYFVCLVQFERAANQKSRSYFSKHLEILKDKALRLSERFGEKKELSNEDQALFYSQWYFSAIRLLTATGEYRSPEAIAEKLDLPVPTVAHALEFLLAVNLLKESSGRYEVGETRTYVGNNSPWVSQHHLNWRLKATQQLTHIANDELVFTNPITVSKKDFQKLRDELVRFIEAFRAVADPSSPEELCFLNIDWRRLKTRT